ncbi:MAG TPA: carboxymuconolactone decarboxylase family protein [Solirubrobacterales bacterium]|nr:carboxymuconolactone decarboxylase family protein [Solirubrobacterales bacterium]
MSGPHDSDVASGGPRVGPAERDELGPVNSLLVRLAGRLARTRQPPNLFTTMGRNRGLFRRWLLFAGALMPGGGLPRRDTELVILRVSHLTGAEYEAVHHRRMGLAAGLTVEQVEAAAADDVSAGPFSTRQALLLRAVDELLAADAIGPGTFSELRRQLSDRDLVELCMLAGHYRMLAGLINSLGIESDVHR